MNGDKRVVVTGIGAVSPLGVGARRMWEGLLAGRSGVGPITLMDHTDHEIHFAGEAPFKPEDYIDRRSARHMDRFTQMAVAAADEAIGDAGLDFDKEDTTRCGVIVGTGVGGLTTIEAQYDRFRDKGPSRVTPFLIPMMMANAASAVVSIRRKLRGPNFTVVTACAAGGNSLGAALHCIQRGEAEIMITGGSEAPVTNLGLSGFYNMGALSRRNDAPQKASRPFDRDRDGFVLAEGAGIVVLEELEHARKRGARIYCEVLGCGITGDGHHLTSPSPDGDGGVRAIRMCLKEAGVSAEKVGYINAHGTSTKYNDKTETEAIKKIFGERAKKIFVSSTKSMTGHTLGAAGGLEFVVCVLSLEDDAVHPTINYETPDPECDLDYVPNEAREVKLEVVLSNSLGFGGHNAVLALGKLR